MKSDSNRLPKTHPHGINSSSFKLKQTASCFDFRELSKALNVASSSSSSSDAINVASNQEGTAVASASAYDCGKLLEALHGIQEVFKSKEEEYSRENVQRCEGRTRVTGKNRKARIERRSVSSSLHSPFPLFFYGAR
ncbi:hypothetical protein ACB092_11G065500 [Castanea dentata]